MLERVLRFEKNLIFYYNRGKEEEKWRRSVHIYIGWAALEIDDETMDWDLLELYAKATDISPPTKDPYKEEEEYIQECVNRFPLMERLARNWVFS